MNVTPLKVSYCTTCKGRLKHIQETLPANVSTENKNAGVEFVIIDYDCPDGTKDWVKANFASEISSGRVRLAHYAPAPVFSMEHAKNLAARIATGDIICNLDAD